MVIVNKFTVEVLQEISVLGYLELKTSFLQNTYVSGSIDSEKI